MKRIWPCSICLVALLAPEVVAQSEAPTQTPAAEAKKTVATPADEPPAATVEFVDRYERRFAGQDPQLDTSMAELKAYDEQGNRFQLRDSQGQYRVLVFGCLT